VQALGVVDLGAHQVLQAQRIDQQRHAIGLYGKVVLALLLIEFEAVLEARTATAVDVDAQLQRRVGLLRDQFADLGRGGRRELQRAVERLVVGCHDR